MMHVSPDDLQREWEKEFSFGPTHRIKEKIVLKLLALLQGMRILDVGCVGGLYTRLLEKNNCVVALDLSHLSVKKTEDSREQKGMSLVGHTLHLPFPGDVFDAVIAFDILEHIDQDEAAVQEIWRVLKRKGLLLFVVPEDMALFSPIDTANGHLQRYSTQEVRKVLAHFQEVTLSDFGFPFMRIYLRLFGRLLLKARGMQSAPSWILRFISPFVVGVFQLDRLFNGSFRGVELFGVVQKSQDKPS